MTSTPRATVNPQRRTAAVPAFDSADVVAFHRRMPEYGATPLRRLANADADGPIVMMKDESSRMGLPAFKILGASWALECALARDPSTTTVIAASAGNHGRAVARAAARRRLEATIHLPATVSEARARPIAAEGARLVRVDGDYDAAVRAAERAAGRSGGTLIADTGTGASAGWVIDGYATMFHEAAAQAEAPIDIVIVPIGVGSLAAAAVRFGASQRPTAAVVIGVEPVTAACVTASLRAGGPVTVATPGTTMTGMDCATPSPTAWPLLRDGLHGTITVTDAEVHSAMAELADHGLAIGDCGAAPVAAVRALVDDPRCAALRATVGLRQSSRVLCVATEGITDPGA